MKGVEFGTQTDAQIEAKLSSMKMFRVLNESALAYLPKDLPETTTREARERVNNALSNHLLPYIEESEIIASQLASPEYQTFTEEVSEYLDADIGLVECPDGRIVLLALVDPGVAKTHRKLQGLPTTRKSGRDGTPVIEDAQLVGRIAKGFKDRVKKGKTPKLIEFLGPHIHSGVPEHGCGACMAKLESIGISREVGMKFGGIDLYFDELGEEFWAFNNNAQRAGGNAETFDLVHDVYSQGFIVGLRNEDKNFDPEQPLRINLLNLAKQGKILMTELLDNQFSPLILETAEKLGLPKSFSVKDYTRIAENAMQTGRIALEITKQQEKEGFSFIPEAVRQGKSEIAIRALAYHAIRNVVFRVLGNVTAGSHDWEEHEETLLRVGPVGPNTLNNIVFSLYVNGEFAEEDKRLADVKKLYDLLYGAYKNNPKNKIDLKKEGRVILVVGEYDEDIDKEREDSINQAILHNANSIRETLPGGIKTGDLAVVALRFNPRTRRFSAIA